MMNVSILSANFLNTADWDEKNRKVVLKNVYLCIYVFFFKYGLLLAPLLLYNRNTTSI